MKPDEVFNSIPLSFVSSEAIVQIVHLLPQLIHQPDLFESHHAGFSGVDMNVYLCSELDARFIATRFALGLHCDVSKTRVHLSILSWRFLMDMKIRPLSKVITVFLVMFLASCASLPNSTTENINDRHTEFALTQHDTVPVVFENGLGGRMEWWKKQSLKFQKILRHLRITALATAIAIPYQRPETGCT